MNFYFVEENSLPEPSDVDYKALAFGSFALAIVYVLYRLFLALTTGPLNTIGSRLRSIHLAIVGIGIIISAAVASRTTTHDDLLKLYRSLVEKAFSILFGAKLSDVTFGSNLPLVSCMLIAVILTYVFVLNFMRTNHYAGFVLFILGLVMYFVELPVNEQTANSYTGFILSIDRRAKFAYFKKSIIPIILAILIVCYKLTGQIVRSVFGFARFVFRIAMLIGLLLLIRFLFNADKANLIKS